MSFWQSPPKVYFSKCVCVCGVCGQSIASMHLLASLWHAYSCTSSLFLPILCVMPWMSRATSSCPDAIRALLLAKLLQVAFKGALQLPLTLPQFSLLGLQSIVALQELVQWSRSQLLQLHLAILEQKTGLARFRPSTSRNLWKKARNADGYLEVFHGV